MVSDNISVRELLSSDEGVSEKQGTLLLDAIMKCYYDKKLARVSFRGIDTITIPFLSASFGRLTCMAQEHLSKVAIVLDMEYRDRSLLEMIVKSAKNYTMTDYDKMMAKYFKGMEGNKNEQQ